MKCRLCDSDLVETVYDGEIRSGGIGSGYVDGYSVRRCKNCQVEFLHPFDESLLEHYDYESEEYWDQHHGSLDAGRLQEEHDPEQLRWLSRIGVNRFRNKRVADFGTAAGQFLDVISGVADETIGVEPASHFESHLQPNGHTHLNYAGELDEDSVDIGVSFDTLEHIQRPHDFLKSIYDALSPGSELFIGVPNQRDFLKDIVPQYQSFFYHRSHLFYYNNDALEHALSTVGFDVDSVDYVHKYNLMNMVVWARDGVPGGHKKETAFDEETESSFIRNVEREGRASHLLVKASK